MQIDKSEYHVCTIDVDLGVKISAGAKAKHDSCWKHDKKEQLFLAVCKEVVIVVL